METNELVKTLGEKNARLVIKWLTEKGLKYYNESDKSLPATAVVMSQILALSAEIENEVKK